MNENCPICNFLEKPVNQILITDYWSVGLTNDQPYLGRARVTLKNHKSNLGELSDEEIIDFRVVVAKIEAAYKNTFSSDLLNWACLMNKEYQKPTPNPHLYWHLFPRYSNPINIGDILFEDKEYGNHYDPSKIQLVDDKTLNLIIQRLTQQLT